VSPAPSARRTATGHTASGRAGSGTPITRDDIEAKLAEIRGGVDNTVGQAQSKLTVVAIGAVALVIVVAFLLGRRRGRRGKTVVEIRRL